MILKIAGVAIIFPMLCMPALAINKCTGPNGNVVFQDTPCAGQGEEITVRPATGHAPKPPPQAAGSTPGTTPALTNAQRINAQVDESVAERRRKDLVERYIPQSTYQREQHRTDCANRQKQLEAGQYTYKQNLYGKTHAAQIASEMAAAASQCETRDRELKEAHEALLQECVKLKCKPA